MGKKLFTYAFISLLVVIGSVPVARAAEPDCAENFNIEQEIWMYNACATEAIICGVGSASSVTLSGNIPAEWQAIFTEAAAKYSVNPNFLAALYLSENGNIWYSTKRTDWPTNKDSGASGPMQFMPGTWAGHKQDGNGDGVKDIMNIYDAVYAAAHLVKALGTDATTPIGSITTPLKKPSLTRTSAEYNWGQGNVGKLSESAPLSALPAETESYVKNVYTLFDSNFTRSGHPNYPDPVAKVVTTGEAGAGTPIAQDASCGGTGGIGSAGGVTFPLITSQTQVKENKPYPWCYKQTTNCHHDYNAADIMMPTGTQVIAAVGGTVATVKDTSDPQYTSSVGSRVIIKGSDGNVWYYTHMGRGTLVAKVGQKIKAGEAIGKVGTNADAQNTPSHLHIDALPPPYSSRMGCGGGSCSSYPFIDIQPALVKAFLTLPE